MTIHIPAFILWMLLGAITIPLAVVLLWNLIGLVIFWFIWNRG